MPATPWTRLSGAALVAAATLLTPITGTADHPPGPRPKAILISLDGARPELIARYLREGVLDKRKGLGRLAKHGVSADENVTATPSVTAVAHIAIATGSTAVHNDISANTFHAVVQPINSSLSGFGAPIGGYNIGPLGAANPPTAEPLWLQLRNAGLKVVTATWPGGDGASISINGTLVQPAVPTRTVDYTVPFGAFGGLGAQGFDLTAASFVDAGLSVAAELDLAGHHSFSPVKVRLLETVYCPSLAAGLCSTFFNATHVEYKLTVAALDTTNDSTTNYDLLVFFDANAGIPAGPFTRPSTGPAYVRAGGESARFFFEGSFNRIGTAYFANTIAPDLSTVRFARYGANFIPRNAAVLANVDDINEHVGFWAPQPDFRIPERISPGFGPFSDVELEAIYEDQVGTFVDYQTRIGLRAIEENPDADLVMIYIEQPDGSGHQFTLTDRRQATNPLDPTSISIPAPGATGQDAAKVARYRRYLKFAYQTADQAVERIMQAVGVHSGGEPLTNVFVVSDHGMAPFHTAVNLSRILTNAGVDFGPTCGAMPATCRVGIRTTGPAANIYVNLMGRESTGNVAQADYQGLVNQIAAALQNATDPNPYYNPTSAHLFTHVWTRPTLCGQPGFCTSSDIGQDTGDVLALMAEGYNFDGAQNVTRLGDAVSATNPYYLPSMSAIFYAAGPDLKQGRKVRRMRAIDVAPTILDLLNVAPAGTVDGVSLTRILKH
jgi:hypothetical protein